MLVVFGDSTTAPRAGVEVYATVLARDLPGLAVVNAGVGGHTTDQGRKRFQTDVLAHQPAVVVIQFGINDAAVDVWKDPPATIPRVSLEDYEANLRYFVAELKKAGAQIVLMTPNPLRWTKRLREMYGHPPYRPNEEEGFNLVLADYAEAVRRIARDEGLPLLDVQSSLVEHAKSQGKNLDAFLPDGMHPNTAAHAYIAAGLKAILEANATAWGLRH